MVYCLEEYPFQFHYYSLINLSLCSGVAVILRVRPASPSVETFRIPPGIAVSPVELPTASHPHS